MNQMLPKLESHTQVVSSLAEEAATRVLVTARMVLLVTALISAAVCTFYFGGASANNINFIYTPLALIFALSAASALWLRTSREMVRQGKSWAKKVSAFIGMVQILADIAIVTGVVYVTGGTASPFLFLYLPLIMASSILFSRGVALIASLVSGCAYSALVYSMLKGWVLPADGIAVVAVPSGGLLLQVVGLGSAMILIAVATSFLTRKLSSSYQMVEQSQRDLRELRHNQSALVDGLPEGVITTRLDGTITNINPAASSLLNVLGDNVLGKSFTALLKEVDPVSTAQHVVSEEIFSQAELTLSLEGVEDLRRIVYKCFPVFNESGEYTGRIFVLQDVTKLRSVEKQLELQERMARLLSAKSDLNDNTPSSTQLSGFVGESPIMLKVFKLIDRVAPSDATVLISGESGTGKELVAKAIHRGSTRRHKEFVAINCGAIPENLIESELFGHKKGSFTGADSDAPGLFRRADGGTLFLDEIGELPLQLQAKLLRTLQEKTLRPVGGDRDIPVDVRIVAATNRNLKKEIEQSKFREDLYYRLNVINLSLPALRERRDDLPILVDSILKRLVEEGKTPVVSPSAMHLLANYDYPGNVRELENILERALVLGGEVILPEHLPELEKPITNSASGLEAGAETQIVIDESIQFPVSLDEILSTVERKYLEVALLKTHGAKKKAADLLGINFRSLRYRLQKFDIGDQDEE